MVIFCMYFNAGSSHVKSTAYHSSQSVNVHSASYMGIDGAA